MLRTNIDLRGIAREFWGDPQFRKVMLWVAVIFSVVILISVTMNTNLIIQHPVQPDPKVEWVKVSDGEQLPGFGQQSLAEVYKKCDGPTMMYMTDKDDIAVVDGHAECQ